jgi:hypothetical protein
MELESQFVTTLHNIPMSTVRNKFELALDSFVERCPIPITDVHTCNICVDSDFFGVWVVPAVELNGKNVSIGPTIYLFAHRILEGLTRTSLMSRSISFLLPPCRSTPEISSGSWTTLYSPSAVSVTSN